MKQHNLTPEALSDHWEAYILPRLAGPPAGIELNEENLKELGRGIGEGRKGGDKGREGIKVKAGTIGKGINKGLDSMFVSLSPSLPLSDAGSTTDTTDEESS